MTTITASQEQQVVDQVPKQLYIAGEWRDGAKGTLTVEDPSTEAPLCEVADASVDDAKAALDAAVSAGAEFAAMAPRERGEILRRAFEMITERKDDLALLMTLEMGKTIRESLAEIAYASEFFRWFSEEAVRIHGRYMVAANGAGRILTMKQAVGPCLMITPWNFPMAMGTRKIGPAVAAGCTMVVKPAQQTPLSMLMLARILEEAGLPGGVLNLITASSSGETAAPLIADPRLRKMSFTGSTEVGRKLMAQASDTLLRLSMELGGNAVHRLRRRRHRRRRDRRDAGQDAQHGRGLHVGQSLPRLRRGGRRVRLQAGGEDGRPQARAWRRRRHRRRPADRRHPARQGLRAGAGRHRTGRHRGRRGPCPRRGRLLLRADRPDRHPGRRRTAAGGDLRASGAVKGFADEDEAVAAANDTSMAWSPTIYTRDRRAARLRAAQTGMIRAQPGDRLNARRRSAGSSSQASVARAGTRGSRSTSTPSTWPSTSEHRPAGVFRAHPSLTTRP
jgi:hypothetical protein